MADFRLRVLEEESNRSEHLTFAKKITDRIQDLQKSGGLPAALHGVYLGWALHDKGFSFGGYGYEFETSPAITDVVYAMRDAQVARYAESRAEIVKKLLLDFKTNLAVFADALSDTPAGLSFHRISILDQFDAKTFAQSAIDHINAGRAEELGKLFVALAERHQRNENWQAEQTWAQQVRQAMQKMAKAHSPLAEAQLSRFFSLQWKFHGPAPALSPARRIQTSRVR